MPAPLIFPTVIGDYRFEGAVANNSCNADWLYRKHAWEQGVRDTTTVKRGWQPDRHPYCGDVYGPRLMQLRSTGRHEAR